MDTMVINQQSKIDYTREMQQLIIKTADAAARLFHLPANTELSVLIVDNNYIQELNCLYRNKNVPTDVLSFGMNESSDEEPDIDFPGDVNIIGDIVISLEQASVQSKEYGHSLERELAYLLAHGILHLLGYDHETEEEKTTMRNLEEKVMSTLKLER